MPRYYVHGAIGKWVLADNIEVVQAWAALQDIHPHSVTLSYLQGNLRDVDDDLDLRAEQSEDA